MSFTAYEFFAFFLAFLILYWLAGGSRWQNLILLGGSYVFYGWLATWHVFVIFFSTLADYFIALGMERWRFRSRLLLGIGVTLNVSLLAFFKYYFYFNEGLANWLNGVGLNGDIFFMHVALPLGLSFYVLKKIGYLIDVQRGVFQPARDFVAFAAYVSFFPQVLSGPIDRPQKLLTQLAEPRKWKTENLYGAWTLLVMGFFKKIVVANAVTVIVDEIFHSGEPSKALLFVAAFGFALQIIADFSSYTDISRGLARLLGLDTTENFNRPYLALTPTEFWNRWHISLSSWLRDYVFFPLRRVLVKRKDVVPDIVIHAVPPLVTMFVSGIWHGVGWKFIVWGLYFGALIVAYQLLGIRGDWKPQGAVRVFFAWLVMFLLIAFSWLIFRSPSLEWLWHSLTTAPLHRGWNDLVTGLALGSMLVFYAAPLIVNLLLDTYAKESVNLHAAYYMLATLMTVVFINSSSPDFVYARF